MAARTNCWEYMRCGREPDGRHAKALGVCPAAKDISHDGTNSGTCGGRFCWAVAGTLCHGQVQGTFAEKQTSCLACDFYKLVRAQESSANIRTKFLRFIHPFSASPILNNLEMVQISRGTRFITQGVTTRTAYIIQQGSCLELVETRTGLHPVGHRSEGDIVGMMSLATGEPMGFHVEAETDMDAWAVRKSDFQRIPEQDPDLYITSKYKTVFIACEYLTGRSLEQLITDKKKIRPDHATAYLEQMLSAMAHAGEKGLVHRDINPANVMVSDNHQVKLIDFGLACPPGTDDPADGGKFQLPGPGTV